MNALQKDPRNAQQCNAQDFLIENHLSNGILQALSNFLHKSICNGCLLVLQNSRKPVKSFGSFPQRSFSPELLGSFGALHTLIYLILCASCKRTKNAFMIDVFDYLNQQLGQDGENVQKS